MITVSSVMGLERACGESGVVAADSPRGRQVGRGGGRRVMRRVRRIRSEPAPC